MLFALGKILCRRNRSDVRRLRFTFVQAGAWDIALHGMLLRLRESHAPYTCSQPAQLDSK